MEFWLFKNLQPALLKMEKESDLSYRVFPLLHLYLLHPSFLDVEAHALKSLYLTGGDRQQRSKQSHNQDILEWWGPRVSHR
jgi:hypothetical protein